MSACDHNVIPIRIRFRARWICVRCDRVFDTPPARHVTMDAETFACLLLVAAARSGPGASDAGAARRIRRVRDTGKLVVDGTRQTTLGFPP